jgi:hypothetical protein
MCARTGEIFFRFREQGRHAGRELGERLLLHRRPPARPANAACRRSRTRQEIVLPTGPHRHPRRGCQTQPTALLIPWAEANQRWVGNANSSAKVSCGRRPVCCSTYQCPVSGRRAPRRTKFFSGRRADGS